MSWHVVRWVLEYSPVEHGERLVLLTMAHHAEHEGTNVKLRGETLERETRLKRRAVQYAVQALVQGGHIEETGRTARGVRIWRVVMDRGDDFRSANWPTSEEDNPPRNGVDPGQAALPLDTPSGGANSAPVQNLHPRKDCAPPGADSAPPAAQSLRPPRVEGSGERSNEGSTAGPDPSDVNVHPARPSAAAVEIWERVEARIRDQVNDHRWHLYLQHVELLDANDRAYTITAPDSVRGWVRDRYTAMIREALAAELGHQVALDVVEPSWALYEQTSRAGRPATGEPTRDDATLPPPNAEAC